MKQPAIAPQPKHLLYALFGPTARVEACRTGLSVVATKSQALKALRHLFGPTARFESREEYGVPVARAVVGQGACARVLAQQAGLADWAGLVLGALPALPRRPAREAASSHPAAAA